MIKSLTGILPAKGDTAMHAEHEAGELLFSLSGLTCAHCASKIEAAAQKLPQVAQATLSFATQRLRVRLAAHGDALQTEAAIRDIVARLEPDVVVSLAAQGGHGAPHGGEHAAYACGAHDHAGTHAAEQESHSHAEETPSALRVTLWRLAAAGLAFAGALCVSGTLRFALFAASYLIAGYDVLLRAARNIARGQIFDENFLMTVASLSAMALGEYAEGAAVMLFYQLGEAFQARAVGNSRKSIAALLRIRPDTATLVEDDALREVAPEAVPVGALVQVRPGERVPLDGVVLRGRAALDTSALTGESLPREVGEGDEVLSGSVNQDGLLLLTVTKAYGESTVAKILDMVQNASERKTRTEQFITRFARVYTPAVVLAALLLACVPPLVVPGAAFTDWLHRGLTFLVVSCPCALVISVPLGYFGGIGAASRAGILCKGSDALDALNEVRALVLDKTGTLTQGSFALSRAFPAPGVTEAELLTAAATAEQVSSHPIAQSILRAAAGQSLPAPQDAQELAGLGVRVIAQGTTLLAGNEQLLARYAVSGTISLPGEVGSLVHVARDGQYLGVLLVEDQLKPDAARAIADVKALGVHSVVMLTGDRQAVAEQVARRVGIDQVHAELLPAQKLALFEEIAGTAQGKVGFVGDGINDAPVLARADVGIAMGGLGSDAAIEAADVVLMTDQPGKLAVALRIARRTRAIVTQNIALALGIKAVVLALSALGCASMWAAVFADVGVSILAILNAMRAARG